MCPACLSAAAWLALGTTSGGIVATLALPRIIRGRTGAQSGENENDDEPNHRP